MTRADSPSAAASSASMTGRSAGRRTYTFSASAPNRKRAPRAARFASASSASMLVRVSRVWAAVSPTWSERWPTMLAVPEVNSASPSRGMPGPIAPGPVRCRRRCGELRFAHRNAAEQHVGGAAKAHALALAGDRGAVAAPDFEDVPGAGEHRRADLSDGDLGDRRPHAVARATEGGDTQHVAPLGRLVLGQ